MSEAAKITILDYKPMPNMGNLRAFVKMQIGTVVIHDYRVVHVEGQSPFVQPPQKQYLRNGKIAFAGPVVEFPVLFAARISDTILDRYTEESKNV